MKTCYGCKIEKPLSEFWKDSGNKDGHQGSCKPCQKAYNSEYNRRVHLAAIEKLGGVCACGFSDPRALQIDHIEGGGSQANKKLNHKKLYRQIIAGDTDGYQVLCANCNWIKRHENGEHGLYFIK